MEPSPRIPVAPSCLSSSWTCTTGPALPPHIFLFFFSLPCTHTFVREAASMLVMKRYSLEARSCARLGPTSAAASCVNPHFFRQKSSSKKIDDDFDDEDREAERDWASLMTAKVGYDNIPKNRWQLVNSLPQSHALRRKKAKSKYPMTQTLWKSSRGSGCKNQIHGIDCCLFTFFSPFLLLVFGRLFLLNTPRTYGSVTIWTCEMLFPGNSCGNQEHGKLRCDCFSMLKL